MFISNDENHGMEVTTVYSAQAPTTNYLRTHFTLSLFNVSTHLLVTQPSTYILSMLLE